MNAEQQEVLWQWVEFAEQDLQAASIILAHEDFHPRISCFLSQQSTEKALKALILYNETPVRKTHDLGQLLTEIPPEIRTCLEDTDLDWLTNWAVESRYPGDWPEASREDALRAMAIARNALEYIRSFLENKVGSPLSGEENPESEG